MSPCPAHDALVQYQNGELADTEAERVEHHLSTCSGCRTSMGRIRAENPDERVVRAVLKDAPAELPPVAAPPRVPRPAAVGAEVKPQGIPGGQTVSPVHTAARPQTDTPRQAGVPAKPRARCADAVESGDWIIPDYERVLLCGEGSYGSVWVVRDRVGVYRALKMIDLERLRQAGIACREGAALETYCRKVGRHPFLIQVYHVGEVGPYLYYTMDLADDQTSREPIRDHIPPDYRPLTLDTIIKGRKPPVDATMEIVRRLLRGLARLHSLDLVHRDVKPSNIVFVNHDPKLADIGVLTADPTKGRLIGTPRYMPPDRVMDQTGDVYAIGRVLHEMLAGRDAPTFPALPEERQWGSMRWDMARVSDVIVRACAGRAVDRYPNAAAMLDDLEAGGRLSYDSLFDELAESETQAAATAKPDILIELGFAFARSIPWILGFIVVMYALSKL